MIRSLAKLAALVAPLLLAGCDHTTFPWSSAPDAPVTTPGGGTGGGGGGGGGGLPQPDFSMSTTALHVSATAGGAAPDPQTFTVRAKPATWIRLQPLDPWIQSADVTTTMAGDRVTLLGTVTVRFAAPDGWPVGTRTGSLIVTGCVDAACTDTAYGSPARLDVTYEVRPATLSASPAALAVTWRQGSPAPDGMATDLRVDSGGAGAATYTIAYDGTTSNAWLSWADDVAPSPTAPQTLRLAIHPEGLAADTYTARLRATALGATIDVPVTLTVEPQPDPALVAAPSQLSFSVTNSTTPADATRTVALSDRGTPVPFNATAPAWLRVTPSSGTTGAVRELTVAVDPAVVGALPNATHEARVELTTVDLDGWPTTVSIPVTLTLDLPRVARVTPWTVAEGDATPVVVRGHALAPAAPSLRFDGVPAPHVDVVSDTELRAVPPSLAPGRHLVSVAGDGGFSAEPVALEVVGVSPRSATSVPVASAIRTALLRDDVRGAVYAANTTTGEVERYRDATGLEREAVALPGLHHIALAPDGARIVAIAGEAVWEIDADTFTLASAPAVTRLDPVYGTFDARWRLAFGNDGVAAIAADDEGYFCYAFDEPAGTIARIEGCRSWDEVVAGSRDGTRVLLAQSNYPSGNTVSYWNASTSTWSGPLSADAFWMTDVALDRTGSRMLSGAAYGEVRDGDFHRIEGRLDDTLTSVVLTDDGTRAIVWDWAAEKIRVFDVSAAVAPGAYFPELGTPGGTAPVAVPGRADDVRLALSVDERTLYLIGDRALVVMPLP